MIKEKHLALLAAAALLPFSSNLQAAITNYEITGYVNPAAAAGAGGAIFNTSTDVPTGGSAANFLATSVGAYVDFTVGDASNPGAGTVANLRVTLTELSPGTEVMLARTSNSQGLTDTGTVSLLIGKGANPGTHTATIQFNWFTPNGSFDTPLANQYTITTFDIDYNQYNEMHTDDLDAVYLANTVNVAAATNLTTADIGGFTRVSDPGGTDAGFADPENAAVFRTKNGSSQEIRVGKLSGSGNQLYMFEFQNPPTNVDITVPEPSSAIIGLAGAALLMVRRRRK